MFGMCTVYNLLASRERFSIFIADYKERVFLHMTPNYDINLRTQAKNAVGLIMRYYRCGAYRAIRDPEGVVSLWSIEGSPNAPFSISFVDKGRLYSNIEDLPPDYIKSFLEYVRKSVR